LALVEGRSSRWIYTVAMDFQLAVEGDLTFVVLEKDI
jgi:hypothetical protein